MIKNQKVLFEFFDFDDEIADDLDLEAIIKQNKLYIKLKKYKKIL